MKNKIKKFYVDHKDVLVSVASGAAGVSVLVAIYAIRAKKIGNEIAYIEMYEDDDKNPTHLNVVRKNNTQERFKWSPPKD